MCAFEFSFSPHFSHWFEYLSASHRRRHPRHRKGESPFAMTARSILSVCGTFRVVQRTLRRHSCLGCVLNVWPLFHRRHRQLLSTWNKVLRQWSPQSRRKITLSFLDCVFFAASFASSALHRDQCPRTLPHRSNINRLGKQHQQWHKSWLKINKQIKNTIFFFV